MDCGGHRPDGREGGGKDTSRENDEGVREWATNELSGKWMMPQEVAEMFGVSPKTVGRWANEGRIKVVVLPSGHRRFYRDDIERFFREHSGKSTSEEAG